jgi:hypothetical protein
VDYLSGGTLAGHLLECGPQATGGNFTDWHLAVETIDTIGYPMCEVHPDGSFDITKPPGTGGIVNVGTVSEQMIYEIGDPQAYIVPDVVCDFSGVAINQVSSDRVNVSGAKGYPATDSYKVSATFSDGRPHLNGPARSCGHRTWATSLTPASKFWAQIASSAAMDGPMIPGKSW